MLQQAALTQQLYQQMAMQQLLLQQMHNMQQHSPLATPTTNPLLAR